LGNDTLNALPTLAYQGVEAFQRWTSKEVPMELFKKAARAHVEKYYFF